MTKDQIREELTKLNAKMDTTTEETRKTRVVVTGNGTKGHEQRLEELEEWKARHPHVCPLERRTREVVARRAVDAAIIGVVVTALLWVLDKVF